MLGVRGKLSANISLNSLSFCNACIVFHSPEVLEGERERRRN